MQKGSNILDRLPFKSLLLTSKTPNETNADGRK